MQNFATHLAKTGLMRVGHGARREIHARVGNRLPQLTFVRRIVVENTATCAALDRHMVFDDFQPGSTTIAIPKATKPAILTAAKA